MSQGDPQFRPPRQEWSWWRRMFNAPPKPVDVRARAEAIFDRIERRLDECEAAMANDENIAPHAQRLEAAVRELDVSEQWAEQAGMKPGGVYRPPEGETPVELRPFEERAGV
jgi:hypothetical protein